tara:strand:+ start:170 stop:1240 length:1071 start_codon:yes stop_codon:yes gene_type:complete
MINKKGSFIEHLPKVVIAVAVLVVIYLALSNTGLIEKLDLFPDFGKVSEKVEAVGILRYSIENRNVDYYDGVNFQSFSAGQEVPLGDEKVEHNGAKRDFERWYYDSALRGEVDINLNYPYTLNKFSQSEGSFDEFKFKSYVQLDSSFDVLVLNYDDKLISGNKISATISPSLAASGNLHKVGSGESFRIQIFRSPQGFPKIDNCVISTTNLLLENRERVLCPEGSEGYNKYELISTSQAGLDYNYALYGYDCSTTGVVFKIVFDKNKFSEGRVYKKTVNNKVSSFEIFNDRFDLKPKIIGWRDGIYKGKNKARPMELVYLDGSKGLYCVEKFDDRYMVIRLENEVSGKGAVDEVCK